tara:strand:+ start:2409 stop:3008 length:600 start_codon:yes stop_codon:yes gene_type:complete
MTDDILKKINIEKDTYVRLLKDILATCRKTYLKLDMYYDKLLWYNSLIQTSVIIASTGSTFIQSFLKEEHDDMVGIITLSVSTYSGLILSLVKFFKLDEKRENVHNLKDRFIELHNRIRHQLDILRPWQEEVYYNNPEEGYKYDLWKKIIGDIVKEYENIITIKKELFIEFDKLINSNIQGEYQKKLINDIQIKHSGKK